MGGSVLQPLYPLSRTDFVGTAVRWLKCSHLPKPCGRVGLGDLALTRQVMRESQGQHCRGSGLPTHTLGLLPAFITDLCQELHPSSSSCNHLLQFERQTDILHLLAYFSNASGGYA